MQKKESVGGEACTELHYWVTQADLPLSCPPRDKRVWDAHPRVYLPIEQEGRLPCPYCGTVYEMVSVDAEVR